MPLLHRRQRYPQQLLGRLLWDCLAQVAAARACLSGVRCGRSCVAGQLLWPPLTGPFLSPCGDYSGSFMAAEVPAAAAGQLGVTIYACFLCAKDLPLHACFVAPEVPEAVAWKFCDVARLFHFLGAGGDPSCLLHGIKSCLRLSKFTSCTLDAQCAGAMLKSFGNGGLCSGLCQQLKSCV